MLAVTTLTNHVTQSSGLANPGCSGSTSSKKERNICVGRPEKNVWIVSLYHYFPTVTNLYVPFFLLSKKAAERALFLVEYMLPWIWMYFTAEWCAFSCARPCVCMCVWVQYNLLQSYHLSALLSNKLIWDNFVWWEPLKKQPLVVWGKSASFLFCNFKT